MKKRKTPSDGICPSPKFEQSILQYMQLQHWLDIVFYREGLDIRVRYSKTSLQYIAELESNTIWNLKKYVYSSLYGGYMQSILYETCKGMLSFSGINLAILLMVPGYFQSLQIIIRLPLTPPPQKNPQKYRLFVYKYHFIIFSHSLGLQITIGLIF